MEMHQIRYALAVAEWRGFTRAAEACGVSQPALTSAIKKLEDELQSPLFSRERSGVQLTEFAQLVLPKFREILAHSECISQIAQNVQRLRTIPVRVGVLHTIGPQRVATYLQLFLLSAAEAEVELSTATHEALLRLLEEGQLDLIISHFQTEAPPWCVKMRLYEEDYRVLLPPTHRLASQSDLTLADLQGEPYIDRLACEMRGLVQHVCSTRGVDFYPAYRTDREEWIESLVARGVGFALMPEFSIVQGGTVALRCTDASFTRQISVARSSEHAVTPVSKRLWQILRKSQSEL